MRAKKMFQRSAIFKTVKEDCKKVKICRDCGASNKDIIKKKPGEPTKILVVRKTTK